MKQRILKIVSGLMLAVFLIGSTPTEYLHALLYEHTDTVDPIYRKGEFVITKAHTHCSFLGFVFAPFIAAEKQYFSIAEPACHTQYVLPVYKYLHSSQHDALSLRGPPRSFSSLA